MGEFPRLWCSLRQSRERATSLFVACISRPMAGKASRSETRHEGAKGTFHERKERTALVFIKQSTTRGRICWTLACVCVCAILLWILPLGNMYCIS